MKLGPLGIGSHGMADRWVTNFSRPPANLNGKENPDLPLVCSNYCTVMRFIDLKETSTDMAADWIFEKFKLI